MLVLQCQTGEYIDIEVNDDTIRIHFNEVNRGKTKVAIDAPRKYHIIRSTAKDRAPRLRGDFAPMMPERR